jgi:multidrug efflux pump subunit AcrA (membrane-fusion protein)
VSQQIPSVRTSASMADSPGPDFPRLIAEIAQLIETAPTFGEFHAEFFQRVLKATDAIGGAVWNRSAEGAFELGYQINLEALNLQQNAPAWQAHQQMLSLAAQRDRALWVPPHDSGAKKSLPPNASPYACLFTPVLVDRQVVGVLEIFLDPPEDVSVRRQLGRFLTELSGFAAAYFYKSTWREMAGQKQLWGQLESLVRNIHTSLDPHEVSFLVAAESRRLLGCDQVSVALQLGRKVKVEAVSGAPNLDQRGTLIQAMTDLFTAVLSWGETLIYQGTRDETLPPSVAQRLDEYLKESNSRTLVMMPLPDSRYKDRPSRVGWMAESFEAPGPTASATALEDRMKVVAAHAGSALNNAVVHERLPLRRLSRSLLALQDRVRGRHAVKASLLAILVLTVVTVFSAVPASLRLEARGQLLPKNRQMVFAPLVGKIVEVKAQNGDVVEKGQELLFLEDLETQLKIDQIGLKIGLAEKRLSLLQEQLGKNLPAEERNNLSRERLQQDYELRRALVERDILLQASRSPRKSPVVAPLAGKVVTFDTQENLVGKTVKPGDPLLRVARVQGPWEMELDIPEGNIAAIREAFARAQEGYLDVDVLLASQPQRTFKGRLHQDGLGGETTVKDNRVVLPARARITDPDLLSQLDKMPLGVELRVRVNCGPHSIGHVWFHDLWEFVYQRLLF